MYPPMEMEGATYYPKPMNCPMHILIYQSRQRSYRELPVRLFEFGTVYRFERSGVLNGLLRVRGITQDDAHIFCTPDQLAPELADLSDFVLRILRAFGLTEFEAELATRPDKFVGEPEEWDRATDALRQAIESAGIPYVVAEGEGAFYAPKIDVHVRDAIGRRWQVSTLQVDFQMPQLFGMEFVGADNNRHRPQMIHRALFGSVERFFAILVEHYAGAFPAWLAPVQARVLPCATPTRPMPRRWRPTSRQGGPSRGGGGRRVARGSRPTGKLEKLPYILVVGDNDVAAGTVGVNARGKERPVRGVPVPTSSPSCGPRRTGHLGQPLADALEQLWAGWRASTSTRTGGPGPRGRLRLRRHPGSGLPDEETHILWRHPRGWSSPSSTPTPIPAAT